MTNMTVQSTDKRTQKTKYTNLTPGTRKTFEERYKIEKGTDLVWSESHLYLYDTLAGQDVEFASTDEFITELNALLLDWGGQRFFYEIPQASTRGTIIKIRQDLAGQGGNTDIKCYSARGATDVQNLFDWATTHGIPTQGFAGFVAGGQQNAPFSGHFGDRSHTVKHYNQKRGSGARLICLHLNAAGSQEVRRVRDDPNFIKKGGEGASVGGFGLKSENNFVSIALGQSNATWDHMRQVVALVELVK